MFTGYAQNGYAGYINAARQHQQGYYFDDAELEEYRLSSDPHIFPEALQCCMPHQLPKE